MRLLWNKMMPDPKVDTTLFPASIQCGKHFVLLCSLKMKFFNEKKIARNRTNTSMYKEHIDVSNSLHATTT